MPISECNINIGCQFKHSMMSFYNIFFRFFPIFLLFPLFHLCSKILWRENERKKINKKRMRWVLYYYFYFFWDCDIGFGFFNKFFFFQFIHSFLFHFSNSHSNTHLCYSFSASSQSSVPFSSLFFHWISRSHHSFWSSYWEELLFTFLSGYSHSHSFNHHSPQLPLQPWFAAL